MNQSGVFALNQTTYNANASKPNNLSEHKQCEDDN